MEIWGMIAVGFFTLAGVILSNILQQRGIEKQREWALRDERRKLKREIMGERIKGIEEEIGLMVRVVYDAIDEAMGALDLPGKVRVDLGEARNRIAEIHSGVWAAVLLTGSDKLKENYVLISKIYWELLETGDVMQYEEDWKKIKDAQLAVITIVDNIRTLSEENGG